MNVAAVAIDAGTSESRESIGDALVIAALGGAGQLTRDRAEGDLLHEERARQDWITCPIPDEGKVDSTSWSAIGRVSAMIAERSNTAIACTRADISLACLLIRNLT